jgi:hypothetical protein
MYNTVSRRTSGPSIDVRYTIAYRSVARKQPTESITTQIPRSLVILVLFDPMIWRPLSAVATVVAT